MGEICKSFGLCSRFWSPKIYFNLRERFTFQHMCMDLNAFFSFLSTIWP